MRKESIARMHWGGVDPLQRKISSRTNRFQEVFETNKASVEPLAVSLAGAQYDLEMAGQVLNPGESVALNLCSRPRPAR